MKHDHAARAPAEIYFCQAITFWHNTSSANRYIAYEGTREHTLHPQRHKHIILTIKHAIRFYI